LTDTHQPRHGLALDEDPFRSQGAGALRLVGIMKNLGRWPLAVRLVNVAVAGLKGSLPHERRGFFIGNAQQNVTVRN
jgi:hypothetical protein